MPTIPPSGSQDDHPPWFWRERFGRGAGESSVGRRVCSVLGEGLCRCEISLPDRHRHRRRALHVRMHIPQRWSHDRHRDSTATPTAVVSACILPALALAPATSAPLPSPTGPPPPTRTAAPRSGTAGPTAPPVNSVSKIAIGGTVPPTISPTATIVPPSAAPTATRVGVPPRRQFLTTTIDGTPGEPALIPVATPPSPDEPAFSQGEICAYVRTHPPHGNGITTNAAPDYRVTAIMLTTLGQFDLMFGESGIAPADTLVYVVELAGQFTISGGPAPAFANNYPSYVEVFDAHTGRLLIEGGFAR